MRCLFLSNDGMTKPILKQSYPVKIREYVETLTKTYVENITLIYNTDMKRK